MSKSYQLVIMFTNRFAIMYIYIHILLHYSQSLFFVILNSNRSPPGADPVHIWLHCEKQNSLYVDIDHRNRLRLAGRSKNHFSSEYNRLNYSDFALSSVVSPPESCSELVSGACRPRLCTASLIAFVPSSTSTIA